MIDKPIVGSTGWGATLNTVLDSLETDATTKADTAKSEAIAAAANDSAAQQAELNLKAPLASPAFTGTPTGVTKTHVGLSSVDNTADIAKPVSTAAQAALDLKASLASPTFTGVVSGVTKTHVGLGSVDNTSDVSKPVSTLQAAADATKANTADVYSKAAADGRYARPSIDTDFSAGLKDRGNRLVQVREAPLTPYQFGAVAPGAVDNTVALTAMFAAANAAGAYSPTVYLPEGLWLVNPAADFSSFGLTNGLTVIGAGRGRTRLTSWNATVPMFSWDTNVSGVRFEDMWIESRNDIFAPSINGGLFGSSFHNMFMYASVDAARIYYQNNSQSFIHNSFTQVEMQRTVGSTQVPFQIITNAGAANFNYFEQVRLNGMNNVNTPFISIESTLPSTYLTDWTFTNILGEQNTAGLIHSKAAYNWTIINATDEDSSANYTADIIRFADNDAGLSPRDIIVMNSGRRGQAMAAGKYEIFVSPGSRSVSVINCNPTPVGVAAKLSLPRGASVSGSTGWPSSTQGSGTPEGFLAAYPGSTYMRTDGGVGTSFYVKESGTSGTGWIAK